MMNYAEAFRSLPPAIRRYCWVAAALLLLLALTVIASRLEKGPLNAVVALVIAIAKAGLVAVFFMHLNIASPMTRIFAAASLLWLSIMMGLTMSDYLTRMPVSRGIHVAPAGEHGARPPYPPMRAR